MDFNQLSTDLLNEIVNFYNEPDFETLKNTLYYILATAISIKVLKVAHKIYSARKNLAFLPTAPTSILPWKFAKFSHRIGNDPVVIFNRFYDICKHSWAKTDLSRGINNIWFAPGVNIVYLFSAESSEALLRSNANINKAFAYDMLHPWLGTGLLTSAKGKWKPRRRMITPAFHFNILQDFLEVMNTQTTFMSEKILGDVREGKCDAVNMYNHITLCALDIICETAMGKSISAQMTEEDSEYINAIYMANKVIMRRIRYPYLINDFIFNMVDSDAKAYWKGIALMKKFTYDVILARLSERENKSKSEETSAGDKKRRAFLDLLLDEYENGNITIDGIREEVDTFMFEGHDTTAAAINFAFYHIAKDPRIKENLQREVDEVFRGDLTRDVTTEDLGKLDYVDAFIREILRLYPSVPMFLRNLSEDLKVNEDYTIPKGQSVAIQTYYVHRDPKHWGADAEECKPERFMDKNIKRHAYAWIPFAAGARNCVGQRFAMMEMKMQVASVIRRLNFEIADNQPENMELYGDMILRPWENTLLKITERTEFNF